MDANKTLRCLAVEKKLWEITEEENDFIAILKELNSQNINLWIVDIENIEKHIKNLYYEEKIRLKEIGIENVIKNRDFCLAIGYTADFCQMMVDNGIACLLYESESVPRQENLPKLPYVIQSFESMSTNYFKQVYNRYHNLPCVIAKKENWILREIAVDDVEKLWDCYSRCGEMPITPLANSIEEEKKFTKAYIEHMYGFYGYGMWVGFWKATKELFARIGFENVMIEQVDSSSRLYSLLEKGYCVQVGYVLRPDFRKKGLALELLRTVLNYGFSELGFEAVVALIHPGNHPSLKLAQKAGMKFLEEVIYKNEKMLVYLKENIFL